MEKLFFTDFVPSSRGAAREKLTQWQKKYPASAFLNIFCLKESRMKISQRQRSKMLLTLPDKLRFDLLQLETAPVVEVREKPQLNIVENKPPRLQEQRRAQVAILVMFDDFGRMGHTFPDLRN